MEIDSGKSYDSSKWEMHLSHGALLCLSIAFSWVLWCIVDLPVFNKMNGWPLFWEILKNFGEQIIETTILLELSLVYIRFIVKIFWNKEKNLKNLIFQVMLLALLNGISAFVCGLAYHYIYPAKEGLFARIAFTDYLNLSVLTTAYLVIFLMNRYLEETEAKIEAEKKLKDEEIILLQSKLKNLSLETNNHFIFNSFSTLSGLIKTAPEDAEDFLHELSNIYRYLVVNGNKTVVELKEELSFIGAYARLVHYRYSGISISIDPHLSYANGFVTPVSVQSLVENAVKHNRHGKENLLTIEIRLMDDYIVVTNNVLPRVDQASGTGIGLANLKERYSLLTNREVTVFDDGNIFEVGIPILYLEDLNDESIDY